MTAQNASRPFKVAWAVFVKTPGLSPVKTRLAKTIGTEKAEKFYRWSVEQTRATVNALAQLCATELKFEVTPIWAVAEKEGLNHALWSGWVHVEQGEGGLGERIDTVYSRLIASHDIVVLFGADSPHLKVEALLPAMQVPTPYPYALGRTDDGGFYLFSGSKSVSKKIWTSVAWSTSETSNQLVAALGQESVFQLKPSFDIDEESDLSRLRNLEIDIPI